MRLLDWISYRVAVVVSVLASKLIFNLFFSFFKNIRKTVTQMRLLEQKILSEGKVLPGDVLKVDGFLNHQIDVALLNRLAGEIYENFKDCEVNKILTVEASGIGLACFTAQFFNCKVLVAKKHKSLNVSSDVYSATAFSFTNRRENNLIVSKEYISEGDVVLIVDDFLANGNAAIALIDICNQAGAKVVGVSCAVEKSYMDGYKRLTDMGYKVRSLARIASMTDASIEFIEE